MKTGNQHSSRKGDLLGRLHAARIVLAAGYVNSAQYWLADYRLAYAQAPASTRRRWKCGM